MKTKKLSKKLTLKKTTVSDLNKQEMNAAQGGKFTYVETCWVATCSCQFTQCII